MDPAKGTWVDKKGNDGYSTFFPDHWSVEQVQLELSEAVKNKARISNGNGWTAITPSGIEVRIFQDVKNNRLTAYPIKQEASK